MAQVRDVGSRLELFVDDWLIEKMRGVELRMHQPTPREVALHFNQPWEDGSSTVGSVMKEGGRYRLWYRAGASEKQNTAYAESDDGVRWKRRFLGLVKINGSSENNVLIEGSTAWEVCVFKDDKPGIPDSERYKANGRVRHGKGTPDWLRGLVSPDGIHWQVLDNDPMVVAPSETGLGFDSQNIAFWDSARDEYVAYTRGKSPGGKRAIRRTVSNDFRNWSKPELIDLGDAPDEHLYTNAAIPYFRAPHILLMFPRRFVPERKFHADFPADGVSEGVFMTSRDGISWDRRFMGPFLPPGPDPGNWTDRSMTIGFGVVPTGASKISLYYKEHNRQPTARLRRGSLRTDGFVSVNADYRGGEFLTRRLVFEGAKLRLNYSTSVAGSVRVEIQDHEGRPERGYTLADCPAKYGDEIEGVVSWAGGPDVSKLVGKPVRLRFVLKDADVYAFRFGP